MRLNSLGLKTVFFIIFTSATFIMFAYYLANDTFSKYYKEITKEKINIVINSISPQISLNLSYGFYGAIDEISQEQLKNKNILLIKIESNKLNTSFIYGEKKLSDSPDNNFISYKELIDPSNSNPIGKLTLVYSSKSYDEHMKNFYQISLTGGIIFMMFLSLISYFLLRSLKPLSELARSMNMFNPYNPEKLNLYTNSNDEIGSIIKSANIMIDNLISYINHSSSLTKELSKQQQHLKEAQRIASVGSWEYDVVRDKLILSDEIYRILGIKKTSILKLEEFLDFISLEDKNQVVEIINSAIENGSTFNIKYKLQLPNNKNVYVRTKGKVRKKSSGDIKLTAVTVDITKDAQNKQVIERLAYYDSLTGLPNRVLFKDRIKNAIANAKRHKTKIAIMFLDLDNFKIVNDTLGHSVGDKLLIYTSKLLNNAIRENDTISRVGGDEFTILLSDIKNEDDVAAIANKIFESLKGEHDIDGNKLTISTSIGIAIYPDSAEDIDNLIRNADTAMYEAKRANKNNYKIFNKMMFSKINNLVKIEQHLRKSLEDQDSFEIHYQPKIRPDDSKISGCEALIRWKHPTKGLTYPDSFIDIAEETGLIIDIGNLVIQKAIKDLSDFNKNGFENLKLAINLSAKQFTDNSLISTIQNAICLHKVDPIQLEFEITESLSMQDISKTLEVLHLLKETGVSIAIDDFGTGYSSLSYLKQFPINTLKIDKSFVLDMTFDNDDKSIVNTIINMAHTLNFSTVAEGVETKEQADILTKMDCDELQGYYYSKPVPKDDFISFLKAYNIN